MLPNLATALLPALTFLLLVTHLTIALPIDDDDDDLESELYCDPITADFNLAEPDWTALQNLRPLPSNSGCHPGITKVSGPPEPWVKADNHYRVVVSRYTPPRAPKANLISFWARWKQQLHVDFCRAQQTDPSITAASDVPGRKIDFAAGDFGLRFALAPLKDEVTFTYKEMVSVRRRLEVWTSEFGEGESVPGAQVLVADVKSNEIVARGRLVVTGGGEGTC